jgi:hypothetical protein
MSERSLEERSSFEERQAVATFAKTNPLACRGSILEKLQQRCDEFGEFMFNIVLGTLKPGSEPFSEPGVVDLEAFDDSNYRDMKAIYDSGMDPVVAKECGQKIADRGERRDLGYGIEEMRGVYYTLMLYSPFTNARDPIVRSLGTTCLNHLWDGIKTPTDVWES